MDFKGGGGQKTCLSIEEVIKIHERLTENKNELENYRPFIYNCAERLI